MKERRKLFEALEGCDGEAVHSFVIGTESNILEKVVQGMSQDGHQRFGELLYHTLRPLAELITSREDDDVPKESLHAIKAITTLLTLFVKQEEFVAPVEVFEAICILHAMLLVLGSSSEERSVQSSISALCELWYSQQREGNEALISQTITFLLLQSLEPNSKAADLKRLYDFRTSLPLIDLDDVSATDLCQLLQRTAIHPLFLVNPQGKKFLTYLFTINLGLIDKMHEAIQYSLLSSKDWMIKAYAEAWRASEGPFRIRIEHNCVQDYIKNSIHVKNPQLIAHSRMILEHFHMQKLNLKHVDSMLVRLYEPIIWRSLQVANPYVRRNAVVQFAIAFPLISDEWTANQVEDALQKQFELIQQLQTDPAPLVRAQAIRLTGHILSTFYDFVPARVSQIYLSTLIHTLSKDQSSADVRSAVVLALDDMIKNPLTHSLLKQMLPDLCHALHDNSERVRIHFIQLLLSVRASKGIKFYDIVDLDNLLARLEADKGTKVQRQITELLVDSYFPYGKKSAEQLIRRCVHLVKTNPTAAKKFYALVPKLVPAGPIVKFMTKMWSSCISQWIIQRKVAKELGDEYQDDVEGRHKKLRKSPHLSVTDLSSVSALFTIMALCWDGIESDLEERDNAPLKTIDESAFLMMYSDLIGEVEAEIDENPGNTPLADTFAELKHSVLKMASNLPASSLPNFVACVLPSLRPYTPVPVLIALLSALFSWNLQGQLIKMITSWIANLNHLSPEEGSEDDLLLEESKFGLSLLDLIFNNDELRTSLLSNIESITLIINTLHPFMPKIEARLSSKNIYTDEDSGAIPDQLLLATLELYYRFMMHVVSLSNDESPFSDLLAWGIDKVNPVLRLPIEEDDDETSRKRKLGIEDRLADHEFGERIMYIILILCAESVITRTSNIHFTRIFIAEAMEILSDCNLSPAFVESIVRCTTKVVYNVYHGHKIMICEEEDDILEADKLQETCVKFFGFLLGNVSPIILAKSLKITEFISLATHRTGLSPIVELLLRKITGGLKTETKSDAELISNVSDISDKSLREYLQWIVPTLLRSNVATNVLASFLAIKILGTEPSLIDKWNTIEVISLLLTEGHGEKRTRKTNNFSPLQNLLINILASVTDDEDEQGDGFSITGEDVKQKAEELLQRSYGALNS